MRSKVSIVLISILSVVYYNWSSSRPPVRRINHVENLNLATSWDSKEEATSFRYQVNPKITGVDKPIDLRTEIETLGRLIDCESKTTCFKQNDPRDYAHQLNLQALAVLARINQRINGGAPLSDEIYHLSRHWIRNDFDLVKRESLKILSQWGKTSELVDLIFTEVMSTPSPETTALAMDLLSQYDESQLKERINRDLISVLRHGGVFPAREVARNLHLVLDDSNRHLFSNTLQEMKDENISQKLTTELERQLSL